MVLINRVIESTTATTMKSDSASIENTVLANAPDSNRWTSNGKSRILEFYGFEGEDFRFFTHSLDSFFALNGITADSRKVAILRAQLRRVAAVYFDNALKEKDLTVHKIAYQDAVNLLQERFVSEAIIDVYQSAFEEMFQVKGESPSEYLSRLYEAADLGNISSEAAIYSRFRAGLLSPIKIFCKEQASNCFKDWIKNSNAWWNAHALKVIRLVDNPFNNEVSGKGRDILSPVTVKEGKQEVRISENGDNPKFKGAYAGVESPTIAELSAKLEALELHSLIPSANDNEKTNLTTPHISSNSFRSENGALKTFIKNIVCQELSNNGKTNHLINRKPRNRRRYDVFDNPYTVEPIHPGYESPSDYDYEKFSYDHATKIYDAVLAKEQAIKERDNYNARNHYQSRYRYDNPRPTKYNGNYGSYGNSRNYHNYGNQGNTNGYNGNSGYQNNSNGYHRNQGYHGNMNGYNGPNGNTEYNGNQYNNGNNQNGAHPQYNDPQSSAYNGPSNRYQSNSGNYDQGNRYNHQYGNKNSFNKKDFNNNSKN